MVMKFMQNLMQIMTLNAKSNINFKREQIKERFEKLKSK